MALQPPGRSPGHVSNARCEGGWQNVTHRRNRDMTPQTTAAAIAKATVKIKGAPQLESKVISPSALHSPLSHSDCPRTSRTKSTQPNASAMPSTMVATTESRARQSSLPTEATMPGPRRSGKSVEVGTAAMPRGRSDRAPRPTRAAPLLRGRESSQSCASGANAASRSPSNFPQVFSHIGLINAAWEIDQAKERS
jgi:hypothetical protein